MDIDKSRVKRQRSLSESSDSSTSNNASRSPSPTTPPPKYHRSTPSSSNLPHICTLPPTCSQPDTATSYATLDELDRHQEAFHKWICRTPIRNRNPDRGNEVDRDLPQGFVAGRGGTEWKECGKAFPEERLMILHQAETHDPITREKQARGDKIFQCFMPVDQCQKVFLTPTKRRLHLIEKHRYPKEYFFSITNHGINQIVKEDGLALSLIRPRKDHPKPIHHISPTHPTTTLKEEPPDLDMDGLVEGIAKIESSLAFVPRGLRKKQTAKESNMEL